MFRWSQKREPPRAQQGGTPNATPTDSDFTKSENKFQTPARGGSQKRVPGWAAQRGTTNATPTVCAQLFVGGPAATIEPRTTPWKAGCSHQQGPWTCTIPNRLGAIRGCRYWVFARTVHPLCAAQVHVSGPAATIARSRAIVSKS